MLLLEIKQVRHICASVWLDQDTVAQVDRYPAFIRASADDVVDKALIRYGGEGVIGFHISWQCKNGASHRKNFDTPPLGRALQSASSALGLLIEFKPLPKPIALYGALGLLEQEMLC